MIMQSNSLQLPWDQIALLLPAIEQTLWDLQPVPVNPGNLTAYEGTYAASVLGGYDPTHHTPHTTTTTTLTSMIAHAASKHNNGAGSCRATSR
jgi:hypothetical protein